MISRLRRGLGSDECPSGGGGLSGGSAAKWVAEDKEEPAAGPAVDSSYSG